MKKNNKTSSVAVEAPKAEVVDTTSSIPTVDTVDTPISSVESIDNHISANATTAAPKAKKVLDTDSFSVSKAIILAYRSAEAANADAEKRGYPRRDDEKDLAQVRLAVFKPHASVWVDVVDRRGGLYRGSLIWVSYMLNTDGTIAKQTVKLHRNGEPTEADLMVASADPNKASK